MNRGFTLVEAVTVIAIMAILFAIFLFDYRSYDARYTTEAVANEIASSLRQVQVWGTSTRVNDPDDEDYADYGYGIEFKKDGEYIVYADRNTNNARGGSTEISTVELANGYEITRFCSGAYDTDGCGDDSGVLNIVVRRPHLGFRINASAGPQEFGDDYAEIEIARGGGERWQVAVWKTGKVEVSRVE